MPDLPVTNDKNVVLYDDLGNKIDVITDSSAVKRLAVDALSSGTGDPTSIVDAGNAFYVASATGVVTVAAGASFDVMIITGTTKEIHLKDISVNVLKNSASGDTQFRLFEAPTTTANGTAATIFNNNRRKDGIVLPDFTAFTAPAVTATGTQLVNYLTHNDWETYIAPSYTNTWEWILKTNTKYILRLFNNTNQSNIFTYLYWLFQDTL